MAHPETLSMEPIDLVTRFANRTRLQALIILAGTVVAIGWCLVVATTKDLVPPPPPVGASTDEDLYRSIVKRIHRGEGYYDAAEHELRAQGYPTRSIFNWRTPLYAWLLGRLPSPTWGQVLLTAGAFGVLLIAPPLVLRRECGIGMWLASVLLLTGALFWCVFGAFYFHMELWSATLIAYSLCAYTCNRWNLGAILGLFALFFRELALPYCVVSLALAWREGRRAEVATWIAGLALFGLFMTFHRIEVASRITEDGGGHAAGWVQFGGTRFILVLAYMNLILGLFPTWFTALYLPLALLGLAGWRGPTGARIGMTTLLYIGVFAVIGQPGNWYWGWMFAPLLAFGFVWSPVALRDLYWAIRRPGNACTRPLQTALEVI